MTGPQVLPRVKARLPRKKPPSSFPSAAEHLPDSDAAATNPEQPLPSKRVNPDAAPQECATTDTIPARKAWQPHLEPKVWAPYVHRPSEPPREVLQQRARKLYAQLDPAHLLRDLGVDHTSFDAAAPLAGTLPLSCFDDTTHETRTHAEWVPADAAAPRAPLRALLLDAHNIGSFHAGRAHHVRPASDTYHVVFADGARKPAWLHRQLICFDAEDPRVFARRLADAYRARRAAESALHASLLVDSMPYGDMPQLTVEQINRILNYTLNNKALKTQMKLMDTSMLVRRLPANHYLVVHCYLGELVNEISIDFARTLNQITFETMIHPPRPRPQCPGAAAVDASYQTLTLADSPPPRVLRAVPETGTVATPPYDFPARFSDFVFASLVTKNEAIAALTRVLGESTKLVEKHLLALATPKPLRIPEYQQLQAQTCDAARHYLRDTWLPQVHRGIAGALERAGKGWYNIFETSQGAYEHSKLKRLLTRVRFAMENDLESLVLSSLDAFEKHTLAATARRITVHSTARVDVTSEGTADGGPAAERRGRLRGGVSSPAPLLTLELQIDVESGAITYCDDVRGMPAHAVEFLDRALAATAGLPQIEPFVMNKLRWAYKPDLMTVHRDDARVDAMRGRVHAAWAAAVEPLQAYLSLYAEHAELLRGSNEAAVRALREKGPGLTLAEVEATIAAATERLERIPRDIPTTVSFGYAVVGTTAVRDKLLEHQADLHARLLKLLQSTARDLMAAAARRFRELQSQVLRKAVTQEEIDHQRQLIADLPEKVAELAAEVDAAQPWFAALHRRRVPLPEDMFKEKAAVEGAHLRLWAAAERAESELDAAAQVLRDAAEGVAGADA